MFEFFSVDSKQLVNWNSEQFAVFCNDLLTLEAQRQNIDPMHVNTTWRTNVPDEGIDASIDSGAASPKNYIPIIPSVWQYKSGGCPSASELKKGKKGKVAEFKKPGVLDAIQNNKAYVFVTAQSLTAVQSKRINSAISEIFTKHGKSPQGLVITGDQLVEWAKRYPSILSKHFKVRLSGSITFEEWSKNPQFNNLFVSDNQRDEIIKQVDEAIKQKQPITRIVGRAGIGKTRLVLEALKKAGVQNRVLYWDDASSVHPESFWVLKKNVVQGSAIFVIDECSSGEFSRLKATFESLSNEITFITVGPSEFDHSVKGALEVGRMDDENLVKVLSNVVNLTNTQLSSIAKNCDGYPKLALLIGNAISKAGSFVSWNEIEKDIDVEEYLNEKLFPYDKEGANSPESAVMRGVSLFTRVGYRESVSHEFKKVIELFGIDEAKANFAVERLVIKGVVSKRGRFLYPSPDVLANYLCRKTFTFFDTHKITDTVSQMGDAAIASFAERMRQLGEEAGTLPVVESFLASTGFFEVLTDLNDRTISKLIQLLTPAYPQVLLHRVASLIQEASIDDLKSFGAGRRSVMWMLQELAWYSEYFNIVADSMLRLALAENESIANNATNVWAQLFQLVLSGTSAPYSDRLPLLTKSVESADQHERLLACKAVSCALQTEHLFRAGGPPTDLPRAPEGEWRPPTYKDWVDTLIQVMRLLEQLLNDSDPEVVKEARAVLWNRGSDLIRVGLAERWSELAQKQTGLEYEQREQGIRTIADQLNRRKEMSATDRTLLENLLTELTGSSFADRLKRVVSSWVGIEYGRDKTKQEADIDHLAAEIIADPTLLNDVSSWLISGKANAAYLLGLHIGRKDTDALLLNIILAIWAPPPSDERVIAGYLQGVSESKGVEWLDECVRRIAENKNWALLAAQMIWRVARTYSSAKFLANLLRTGQVEGNFLTNLELGFWARDLDSEMVKELLHASSLDKSKKASSGRLGFLNQYVTEYPQKAKDFTAEIWSILDESANGNLEQMDGYHWSQLAQFVLQDDPARVARLVVNIQRSDQYSHEVDDVLNQAIQIDSSAVFTDVISKVILDDPLYLWKLENPIEGRYIFASFDPDTLIQWIDEDINERLSLIAHAAPVIQGSLSQLARKLLIKYGPKRVGSALAATSYTGSYWGRESDWLKAQLDNLDQLKSDPEPNVRQWASELRASVKLEYDKALSREEEDDRYR